MSGPHHHHSSTEVERRAREYLSVNSPSSYAFREVSLTFADGTLVLEGRVPSFYLKQVLQEQLKSVDGVRRVDNRVDVVNSTGLSSTRWRY